MMQEHKWARACKYSVIVFIDMERYKKVVNIFHAPAHTYFPVCSGDIL